MTSSNTGALQGNSKMKASESELRRLYLVLAYNDLCSKCGSALDIHHQQVCEEIQMEIANET